MYLIPVIIGMATLGASAYGLGKHDKNRNSQEYTASLAFFSIGLCVSILSIVFWAAGNIATEQCAPVVQNLAKTQEKGLEVTKQLGECKTAAVIKDTEEIEKNFMGEDASET
jgi:hypothetical protein